MSCPIGKLSYETAQALSAFDRLIADPLLGSIYACQSCGQFPQGSARGDVPGEEGRCLTSAR